MEKSTDDLPVYLAKLRHVLRSTAQSGRPNQKANNALVQLKDLAHRLGDVTLTFEARRWEAQLGWIGNDVGEAA